MRILSIAVAGLIVWAEVAAQGQSLPAQPLYSSAQSPSGQSPRPQVPDGEEESLPARAREQQVMARNAERQKKLTEDTAKLLALATELKEQVDKTDKDILSVDVIKKTDEIEKLAKSIRERMKGSGV